MIRSTTRAVRGLLALGARPSRERLLEQVGAHLQVAPGHDVVEHAHALEEREVLEGARDAHLGHLARVHVAEGLAAQADRALLRLVDAVDAVEHRALAGAVRADDGADLVLADVEADVGQRLHAAEAQADVAHVEDDVAGLRAAARRGRPSRGPAHGARTTGTSTILQRRRDLAACGRPRTSPRSRCTARSCRRRARRPAPGSARR